MKSTVQIGDIIRFTFKQENPCTETARIFKDKTAEGFYEASIIGEPRSKFISLDVVVHEDEITHANGVEIKE